MSLWGRQAADMSVQTSFPSVSDLLTISTSRGIIRRPRQKEETTSRRVRKGRAKHVAAHRRHSGGSVGRVALKILLPALAITTEHLDSRRSKTKHHRVSGQHQVCRCGPRCAPGWCGGRRGRGQRILNLDTPGLRLNTCGTDAHCVHWRGPLRDCDP